MGLLVSAQAVRDLISEGEYVVECIEQREHGRLAVTLALRSRTQPYTMHIEMGEGKLEGLFRALLTDKSPARGGKPVLKVGSQVVPVTEVEAMPADQPKRRRRRRVADAATVKTPNRSAPETPVTGAERRRSAIRQLVLVPQETRRRPAQTPDQARPRTRSKPSPRAKNR
ncbi:MAG: hypothetical protein HYZ81_09780 [Nitrospinae bacterium]|nr:hypothetical protein [Nitrospinota bacterium]